VHPKKQSFRNIEAAMSVKNADFSNYISEYENFPKSGILFRDISPLLASPVAMQAALESFTNQLSHFNADMIVGIESRGFLFSTLLSYRLGIGSLMIRKQGKLPGVVIKQNYALEYGKATLEIQNSAQIRGKSMILIDDLLATGGTVAAAKSLLERCGAVVAACAVVVELKALQGRKAVGVPIISLQSYD
jgi:adenine phosphoribosyltransferase